MNAQEFFNAFVSMVREDDLYADGTELLSIYRSDEPTFTKIINNMIVPKIIENQGWTKQNEYFRIDTVGWKTKYETLSEEDSKRLGLSRHLWDLKIAVEHENKKSDWTDELIKLVHIRCPLKVIIGYVYCDERGDMEKEKLEFAYNCLTKIDVFDPDADEELLIIFGNGAPRHKGNKTYDKFDYRGYALSKGATSFVELKCNKE